MKIASYSAFVVPTAAFLLGCATLATPDPAHAQNARTGASAPESTVDADTSADRGRMRRALEDREPGTSPQPAPGLGPNLSRNGDFSAGSSNWSVNNGGWSFSGGRARFQQVAGASNLSQPIAFEAGAAYQVSFEVSNYQSGDVVVRLSGGSTVDSPVIHGNGRKVVTLTPAAGNVVFNLRAFSTFVGSIDNVEIRRVGGQASPPAPQPDPDPEPTPPGLPPGTGGAMVEACDDHYAADFVPVTGTARITRPGSTSRPAKGQAITDPNFGTCIVRATNYANEPVSGFARNDYARRQAFNADNTLFIVHSQTGHFHLYDAIDLSYIRVLTGLHGGSEPKWHPTDPHSLRYIPSNARATLREMDVISGESEQLVNFNQAGLPWGTLTRAWTRWEGSPSADGRYLCLMAEGANESFQGVFTYDLEERRVLGTRNLGYKPDHVSMTPSGRWCQVSNLRNQGGMTIWNRSLTNSRMVAPKSEHADIGIGPEGDDYLVWLDYDSARGDYVMLNLETNQRTTLFQTYIDGTATAHHVSAKNFDRPGWFLVSTYARSGGSEQWLHEKIFAVEMKANPTIIQIAHHQSRFNGYWTEPHASVSRDFSRILFNSNWGTTAAEDIDAYMIQLPEDLLD